MGCLLGGAKPGAESLAKMRGFRCGKVPPWARTLGGLSNLAFCRKLLAVTFAEVRAFEPKAMAKDAAAMKLVAFRNTWFFQVPDRPWYGGAFSWTGRADNAYHAKAQGWAAWLAKRRESRPCPR